MIAFAAGVWTSAGSLAASGPGARGAGNRGEAVVRALAAVGSARDPSISPHGRSVAFVSGEDGHSQIWVVSRAGGAPVRITGEDDPVGSVFWSPRGDWLAYTVLPGGSNAAQIYLVRPDGSARRRVSPGAGETNELTGWSADGRYLLTSSTSSAHPADFQPQLIDVAEGTTRAIGPVQNYASLSTLSADGTRALVSRMVGWEDTEVLLVDTRRGQARALTKASGPGSYWATAIAPDGGTGWITGTINGSDRIVLGRVRLDRPGKDDKIEIVAARADAELESATFDPSARRALLVWNVGGRSEVEWLDTATGRRTPGPALPVDVVRSVQVDDDGAVIAGTGATTPEDLYGFDWRTARVAQLTQSRHDGIDLATLVRPMAVHYTARDGVPLSGWLYRPHGFVAPGPLVQIYHGGPEDQARPRLDPYVQSLLARGIAVFTPNIRGSTGFGRQFMQLDNGAGRRAAINDVADTTAALVASGVADRARLGIQGGSYGGYVVLSAITRFPDMFAAAVDMYGVADLQTMFSEAQPWVQIIAGAEYGDPRTAAKLLREMSPVNHLDRVKAPLLILHGVNDRNVPIRDSERVLSGLKAHGRSVRLLKFANAGHGFDGLADRILAVRTASDFMADHLKPMP